MTAGESGRAEGETRRHVPVLARTAVDMLGVRSGGIYIDGTFGAGGYSRIVLETPGAQVLAIDRDRAAVTGGAQIVAQAQGRLTLAEGRFSALDDVARRFGHEAVDGVVLDLGVSSMQLDEAERGFSFRHDGPLDMRMGGDGSSAADVIAHVRERDLADIVYRLGEERRSRAVARAIVAARSVNPIRTTRELAEIVARAVRAKPGPIHPATRTFQALRIFVNEELRELALGLAAAERILKPGGRLAVVSFHSLEDRIVKTFLAERSGAPSTSRHRPEVTGPAPSFSPLTRRPVEPGEAEVAANPRARSAKLRAAKRTAAAAHDSDVAALLPRLPSLADTVRPR